MDILSEVITVMQSIILLSLTVRFVICCIQLSHNIEEKAQITKQMKNILIAVILTVTIFPIVGIVKYYYNK